MSIQLELSDTNWAPSLFHESCKFIFFSYYLNTVYCTVRHKYYKDKKSILSVEANFFLMGLLIDKIVSSEMKRVHMKYSRKHNEFIKNILKNDESLIFTFFEDVRCN